MIRSWLATVSWYSASWNWRWPCRYVARLAGRYRGWEALIVAFWVPKARSLGGLSTSRVLRFTPADTWAWGRRPDLACSARYTLASYCDFADCQVASYARAASY